MSYIYEYPRPMITVDILLFRYEDSELEILLIERKKPPFKNQWAFPGGYVEIEERLLDAAGRELLEETGVQVDFLFPLHYADDPQRDPRGRTISFIFGGILSPPFSEIRGGDDATRAAWHSLMNLPKLAFDHNNIVQRSEEQLKHELQNNFLIAAFLPLKFTLSDLEQLFQKIYHHSNGCSEWLKKSLKNKIIEGINQNEFSRIKSAEVLYSTPLIV